VNTLGIGDFAGGLLCRCRFNRFAPPCSQWALRKHRWFCRNLDLPPKDNVVEYRSKLFGEIQTNTASRRAGGFAWRASTIF